MKEAILYYIIFLILLAVPILITINFLANKFHLKKDDKKTKNNIRKLFALILLDIVFVLLSLLPLNKIDNIRKKKIEGNPTTYQTIIINGTEYELVPKS